MQSSFHSYRRKTNFKVRRIFALLIIAAMLVPIPQLHAEAVRRITRQAFSFIDRNKLEMPFQQAQEFQLQPSESPAERAAKVALLRLCPRRLSLYVGESFTLVPLPLDQNREVVHGVGLSWSAANADIASVTSWGEVSAVAAGQTVVTVQAGVARAKVAVEVRSGTRQVQNDLEWELNHSQDCGEPESSQLNDTTTTVADNTSDDEKEEVELPTEKLQSDFSRNAFKALARPAALRVTASSKSRSAKAASKKIPFGKVFPVIDPDSPDTSSPGAAQFNNAVGSPRFTAQEDSPSTPTKTRRQLGSHNYMFTAPVLGLGGRGIGVNLELSYNSRLWNKDSSTMTFNYSKGWPAAGWTLGFGRVIKNYDSTATGTGTGIGFNAPGNRLLIQPDGTRIHLQQNYVALEDHWEWDTNDGTFLHMTFSNKIKYPDGSIIKYDEPNNRLVPTSIKTVNGDLITIAYRTKTSGFPYRWAIDFITDTLGRVIQFKYYGDSGYPVDAANGKPQSALAAVTAPNLGGAGTRTLVQIEYQDITLSYNFGSMTVVSPGNNTALTVVKRLYYPQTGKGYLFLDYSTYGVARKISVRKDMTGAGGTIANGTEIAYTTYNYTTIDPFDPYGRNQVGTLNDSPQYTQRGEWWQGKTDDNGNADSTSTIYGYSRTTSTNTETDTTTYPSVTGGQLTVATTTDTNTGFVTQVEYKNGATVLGKTLYTYTTGPDGGSQIGSVETFDEANTSTRVEYGYESYGRVKNFYEYGYKSGSSFKVRRRTRYIYSDSQAHIDARLLRLLTDVRVYDALINNDNNDDVMKARIIYSYDDYAVKGGMETYGLIPANYPPNHDTTFDQTDTARGNVTGVQTFSSLGPDVSTTRYTKYDIFGNAVEVDVSCCQVKTIKFKDDLGNAPTYYSQPMSIIDGRDAVVPFLKAKFQYDFNTGLVTSLNDQNNQTTTFAYDTAWHLTTVTGSSGAVTTTQFDKDANGNDQLAYSQKMSYTENGVSKAITTKSWFDGAGRVLRSGSGAGTSPTNFDTVASVYDRQGRALKQSNPYVGDSSGNGSPLYWTTTSYDLLSRVTQVKLADNQTITTSYAGASSTVGATMTVTDQVGRQNKSESDGLGRATKITEQDPATGGLNWPTTYSYDVLDNLTSVNQNNQTRTSVYDALSRMTSQTTPEAATVSYAYTDFDAVKKRVDARGVETHYKYDSLNRLAQVWYTGAGGDDAGSIRPALPAGVAATSDVTLSYNNLSTSQAGNGQVNQVTNGAGTETYSYDTLGRVQSMTRAMDARSYQTQYLYNTANQITTLIYPSGKRVRMNHDTRGRVNGLDKVDASGNVLGQYVTSVGYNTANQVTNMGLANGVSESYGYSADRLQMTSQSATKSGSTLMSLSYGYSAGAGQMGASTTAGNSSQLVSITGTVNGAPRNQAFTYDNVGRLLTATGTGWQRRYGYDRWGNRTGMWDAVSGGVQIQNISIATTSSVANNRIANVNAIGYVHDNAGDVTSDGAHSYGYDAESRLVSVDGGSTASYAYNARNGRVKKVTGGATTHCVWEGSQVIAEYNAATGALISEYIYAGSRMVARDQGGVLRYYHQDRLSTRLITDGSGAVVGAMDHQPFGEDPLTGTGENEKHRFTSYERDNESGTDYAMNRQYQTSVGRFMRPDPIVGELSVPQSWNRYSYTASDPISFVDPTGLMRAVPIYGTACVSTGWTDDNGSFHETSRSCEDYIAGVIWIDDGLGSIIGGGPRGGIGLGGDQQDTGDKDKGCFDKVAQQFGGSGAVGGDHHTAPGKANADPLFRQKAHVYPSANGSGQTNIYVPEGYDKGVNVRGDNSTVYFHYANLKGYKDVTLLVQHVTRVPNLNNAKTRPENGRVFIGTTGGLDGGQVNGPTYQHAHIEVFQGPLPDLIPGALEKDQTHRNAARIPYRDVFCK